MQRISLNVIFFLQALLLFLFLFEDRLSLPTWLQIAGRLHPAVLHLPIGAFGVCAVLVFMESQFKKKAFTRITLTVLLFTSLTTSVTALLGIFLANQGDYDLEALTQHKNSGIVLSFLCYLLLAVFVYARKNKIMYYGFALMTAGTMVFAGHTGSVLTHGENFVLAPLKNSGSRPFDFPSTSSGQAAQGDGAGTTEPAAFGSAQAAFQQVIYPILDRKCTSCHNRTKRKGKFVMTSKSEFMKGGEHGQEWVAGKPNESRMIQYIHLPLKDDDHMPPDGKPQLTWQEKKLIEYWIASGGDVEKKFADFPATDSFRIVGSAGVVIVKSASHAEEKTYTFSAASEETIQRLNTPFRVVFPLSQTSPALQVDFFIKESFKSMALEELMDVQDQLVVLNLSKMPVTDPDLKVIGRFNHLERLNLNFSKVSGSGLSSLQGLNDLESLSLAGTSINAESLTPVLAITSLRELFIWNTKVTEEEKAKLALSHPNISIVTTQFIDDEILRLGKPLRVNEGILKKGDSVVLDHSMPGVTIRYTLDGRKPDSLTSTSYNKPIRITSTSTVKAIACRPQWYCSEVYETTCFVEGLKPMGAELLTQPDKTYPGEGKKSLVDGKKGFIDSFKEPAWLGYQNQPLIAGFDFGSNPPILNSIVISYGTNVGSHIVPPEMVEVWAGRSSKEVKLIQSMKVAQPVAYDPPQIIALAIPIKASRYAYYKVVAKPVKKLPAWHSGKGKKGWVFVDEIFFY